MESFAEYFKRNRSNFQLSQAEIAKELAPTTIRTISAWETGENEPQPKMKRRIEKLFSDLSLKSQYKDVVEVDVGAALRRIEARQEVELGALAEILAHHRELPFLSVLEQLQSAVNQRLGDVGPTQ